jgi:hypothetical protein
MSHGWSSKVISSKVRARRFLACLDKTHVVTALKGGHLKSVAVEDIYPLHLQNIKSFPSRPISPFYPASVKKYFQPSERCEKMFGINFLDNSNGK